ncbi:hypothetical protein PBY51_016886 [Eleginops maclovinus]|uniref:Uncharacterized protein n=1 Tax=Eleginops maclovinus TaxID=56733 RepID=A0AAN8A930_ELEMC|nr:hypothetical protein PBY51_016886 [Eleginops maclovinus]
MDLSTEHGDLARFWEEIPAAQSWQLLQDVNQQRIQATLLQLMVCSSRLEQKLESCLWTQRVFILMVTVFTVFWAVALYVHFSHGYSIWTTA